MFSNHLIDSADNFVRTYSATTVWQSVEFSSADLTDLQSEVLTLNFISMNNSSTDFLYVNRPITLDGALIPEPSVSLLGCAALALVWRRRR
jgi:hypothetical protein